MVLPGKYKTRCGKEIEVFRPINYDLRVNIEHQVWFDSLGTAFKLAPHMIPLKESAPDFDLGEKL